MPYDPEDRPVPKFQLIPINGDRLLNNIEHARYHGKPYLTDETDIFDVLYDEDIRFNREKRRDLSIQKWGGRRY